jgi:ribose/xylose/arabinose/galactoside ABC-type transport system permease subunit
MQASKVIPSMLGWGLFIAIAMMAFFMFFEGAIPLSIAYCLNAPAVGFAWLWQSLNLPPHSEAAFAMPLVFGFAQWFLIGALFGLWRNRKRQK